MTAPITRAEAIAQGLTRYFTGAPCKHGHVTFRTVTGGCAECARVRAAARRADNPEAHRAAVARYRAEHPEKVKARLEAWRSRNKEHVAAYSATRREKCADKIKAEVPSWKSRNKSHVSSYAKKYKRENRAEYTALEKARKALKLRASPRWITDEHREVIREMYREAERRSTGALRFHVDHIFPLKGRNFSGLHVPWNLQILEAAANMSKKNRFPEEFWEWAW